MDDDSNDSENKTKVEIQTQNRWRIPLPDLETHWNLLTADRRLWVEESHSQQFAIALFNQDEPHNGLVAYNAMLYRGPADAPKFLGYLQGFWHAPKWHDDYLSVWKLNFEDGYQLIPYVFDMSQLRLSHDVQLKQLRKIRNGRFVLETGEKKWLFWTVKATQVLASESFAWQPLETSQLLAGATKQIRA